MGGATINYEGVLLGLATFLIIGVFHPIVIKGEYYFGTKIWWVFLLFSAVCLAGAMMSESLFWSALLSITAFSSLWSIKELFEQKERVRKGWFPKNPKRKA